MRMTGPVVNSNIFLEGKKGGGSGGQYGVLGKEITLFNHFQKQNLKSSGKKKSLTPSFHDIHTHWLPWDLKQYCCGCLSKSPQTHPIHDQVDLRSWQGDKNIEDEMVIKDFAYSSLGCLCYMELIESGWKTYSYPCATEVIQRALIPQYNIRHWF